MRMWKIPAKYLCRKHLLGEHVEHHMFVGSFLKRINLKGFIDNGMLDSSCLATRHAELVDEMLIRGYNHKTPIDENVCSEIAAHYRLHKTTLNIENNIRELIRRCPECTTRISGS